MRKQSQKNRLLTRDAKHHPISAWCKCCFILLALGLPAYLPAQVNTVVRLPVYTSQAPPFKVIPNGGELLKVTANGTEEYSMSFLQFDLSTLPPGISIQSASLRLTLATDPSDQLILVVHRVVNDSIQYPKIAQDQIASRTIRRREYSKDSTIILRDLPIDNQALTSKKFTIRLSTSYRNGNAAFYSSLMAASPVQLDSALIPRLVISYQPRSAQPPLTWGAYKADAQHTSRSAAIFVGDVPSVYAVKQVWQANNNIKKNMTLYKDKIYLVAQDGASVYNLYRIDPVTRTVTPQVRKLDMPEEMAAIDPFGRYYHITANEVSTINLATADTIARHAIGLSSGTIVEAPPVVGADGTLYLTTSSRSTGFFSLAAYTPYPLHQLLWRYAAAAEGMSSVALSNDGMIAYVLFAGDSLKIAAINTVSGQSYTRTLGKWEGSGSTDKREKAALIGKMAPVINNLEQLFITDNFPAGKTLYVLNPSLVPDTILRAKELSQPVVDGEGTVYYAMNDNLMSYKGKTALVKGTGRITSMIADAGNNIYYWNADRQLKGYSVKSDSVFFTLPDPLKGASREWELTLAPDGSLYTGTTTGLFAIRPSTFKHGVYNLTKEDLNFNNRSFRAYMIIVGKGIDFGDGYNTTLTGTKAISINNVLKKGSSAQLVSGGTIALMPGFTVEKGAQLSCKTGY